MVHDSPSGDDVVSGLLDGNHEYRQIWGVALAAHISGQKPYIAILTCSDSRVVPELIFSKSIGEMFVVRVAGNVACDPSVIASLEYAVEHLGVVAILVMGHSDCGALKAAESGGSGPLLDEIRKGFTKKRDNTRGNVERQVMLLPKRSVVIKHAMTNGKLTIIGAVYNIANGCVMFLDETQSKSSSK
jgi:carbonic anhydrase